MSISKLIGRHAVLLAAAAVLSSCTKLFFYPGRVLERTPADLGLYYQEIMLETRDGVQLHGWRLPASGEPWARVLFFHGNAENISTHVFNVFWLPAQGVEVFLFDYRGFGESGGSASLPGVHIDALDMISFVFGRAFEPAPCRVVFGQSLGAALAAVAVAEGPPVQLNAMILESSFADYRMIAEEKLAAVWLTRWLRRLFSLGFSFEQSPRKSIGRLAPTPVLLIHGSHDPIVPLHHSLELFLAAGVPKELWIVDGGGHTDALLRVEYRLRLMEYLAEKCSEFSDNYLEVRK